MLTDFWVGYACGAVSAAIVLMAALAALTWLALPRRPKEEGLPAWRHHATTGTVLHPGDRVQFHHDRRVTVNGR